MVKGIMTRQEPIMAGVHLRSSTGVNNISCYYRALQAELCNKSLWDDRKRYGGARLSMIRLWLSRNTDISIREQLNSQFILGILSRRLAPGERLPSVRELARRLKIHSNTVGAVYRDLSDRGWVSGRSGSGVYVKDVVLPEPEKGVEEFTRAWIQNALALEFTFEQMEEAFRKIRDEYQRKSSVRSLLIVHPDRELACVLAAE